MDKGTKFLIFAGIAGFIGLGIFAVYQATKSRGPAQLTYTQQDFTQINQNPGDNGVPRLGFQTYQEEPVYQNHEEITFPDGFDPDTLMPRKIVVTRNYKVRVQ